MTAAILNSILRKSPGAPGDDPDEPQPTAPVAPRKFWLLLGISAGLAGALMLWAGARREVAVFLYGQVAYWLVLALLATWAWQVGRNLATEQFRPWSFLRRNWLPLSAAGIVTGIALVSVRPQFRVLSDETNLLAVSQSMLYHKTPYNSTDQKRYYGWMTPLSFGVEKRPLVFPFLVHGLHALLGYAPENAFRLNAIAFGVLLALVGIIARRHLSATATVAAVLLVGSYPLVVNCARSAGFDLLATLFAGLSFALAYSHMRAPSADRLALLVCTLLVSAQVRYESALYGGVIGGMLCAFGYVRLVDLRSRPLLYWLAPFLVLPLLVQRTLTANAHENPPGVAAFSVQHFTKFVGTFLRAQTNGDFRLPHVPPLYWAAAAAVGFLLIALLRGRLRLEPRRKVHLLAMALVCLLVNYAIVFSFHGSDFTHPGAVRYFLNLSILVALAPVLLHAHAPRVLTAGRLFAGAAVAALIYHPLSVQGKFTLVQTLVRETEIEWEFLRKHGDRNILIVTDRPGQFTPFNYGAVGFSYANANTDALLYELKRHLYTDIIVFQKIAYEPAEAPVASDYLRPEFKLEKLLELQNSATDFLRISRVAH